MSEKKQRVEIPADIASEVLFRSDRTCCVCRQRGKPVHSELLRTVDFAALATYRVFPKISQGATSLAPASTANPDSRN
jgi:hypothetical protein